VRPQPLASCHFEEMAAWDLFFAQAAPLMQQHYEELSLEDRLIWEPDHELYRTLGAAGRLQIVVARDGLALVGYHIFLLHRHPHYRLVSAHEDTVYLHPGFRRGWTGYKLIRSSITRLKLRGVQRVVMHEKTHNPLHRLYLRLGADCTDHVWTLKLGV